MIGIDLATPELTEAVQWACFQRGLLVLEAGVSTVRMSPPLVVSESEMATALRLFEEAVAEVAAEPERVADEAEAAGALDEPEAAG